MKNVYLCVEPSALNTCGVIWTPAGRVGVKVKVTNQARRACPDCQKQPYKPITKIARLTERYDA